MATEIRSTLEQLAMGVANVKLEQDEVPAEETETVKAEAGTEGETPVAEAPVPEPEEEIRIGGQTFKTQAEAFRYAEQLEQDKLISEAHTAGVSF